MPGVDIIKIRPLGSEGGLASKELVGFGSGKSVYTDFHAFRRALANIEFAAGHATGIIEDSPATFAGDSADFVRLFFL